MKFHADVVWYQKYLKNYDRKCSAHWGNIRERQVYKVLHAIERSNNSKLWWIL